MQKSVKYVKNWVFLCKRAQWVLLGAPTVAARNHLFYSTKPMQLTVYFFLNEYYFFSSLHRKPQFSKIQAVHLSTLLLIFAYTQIGYRVLLPSKCVECCSAKCPRNTKKFIENRKGDAVGKKVGKTAVQIRLGEAPANQTKSSQKSENDKSSFNVL